MNVIIYSTAGNVETEQGIQEILREMTRDHAVITIAHRLNAIADSDEIHVFENGEITRKKVRINVKLKRVILYDLENGKQEKNMINTP